GVRSGTLYVILFGSIFRVGQFCGSRFWIDNCSFGVESSFPFVAASDENGSSPDCSGQCFSSAFSILCRLIGQKSGVCSKQSQLFFRKREIVDVARRIADPLDDRSLISAAIVVHANRIVSQIILEKLAVFGFPRIPCLLLACDQILF